MIAYLHHADDEYLTKHKIMRCKITPARDGFGVGVQSSGTILDGCYYRYLYVINLETGEEFIKEPKCRTMRQIKSWVHDPLIRAVKVAEFKKKERAMKWRKK